MASQALVFHVSETIGGQNMAGSALEEPVITDGWHCVAPGPSSSAALGLDFGASSLITECEPAIVHTITSSRATSTRQPYTAC